MLDFHFNTHIYFPESGSRKHFHASGMRAIDFSHDFTPNRVIFSLSNGRKMGTRSFLTLTEQSITEFPYGNAVTDCIYDGKETPSAVLFVLLVSTREYYRMVKEFLRKIFFRPIVLKKYDEISG